MQTICVAGQSQTDNVRISLTVVAKRHLQQRTIAGFSARSLGAYRGSPNV